MKRFSLCRSLTPHSQWMPMDNNQRIAGHGPGCPWTCDDPETCPSNMAPFVDGEPYCLDCGGRPDDHSPECTKGDLSIKVPDRVPASGSRPATYHHRKRERTAREGSRG